jgi:AcrR family transcriptional regulator
MAPKIVDRDARRRELAAAAAEVFAERGYEGTRIADVAERAGVGKGTVYEYFGSKEELFFAVFEEVHRELDERLERVVDPDAPAPEQLRVAVRSMVEETVEQVELYGLTLELWTGASSGLYGGRLREAFVDLYGCLRGQVAGIVRAGQAAGELRAGVDPDGLAAAIVGAVDALGLQHWLDRSLDAVAAAETFVDALFAGLVAGPPASKSAGRSAG